jgi:two-component system response regulator MprA
MSEAILVVDDDAPIRRTLAAEGYAVHTAADGGAALAAVERSVPDLVLLDVAMAGLDGLSVCRRLRAKGLGFPILMLTARDAVVDRVAGLDAGADDYLVKPFAPQELLARIRALLRRGRETPSVLGAGDLVLDVSTRTVRRGERTVSLSERETMLLELLLRRPARSCHARLRSSRYGAAGEMPDRTWSTATSRICATSWESRR